MSSVSADGRRRIRRSSGRIRSRARTDEMDSSSEKRWPVQVRSGPSTSSTLCISRRLWIGVSRPDRGDPHAAADRRRAGAVTAVRVDTVWRLLRGLPGEDRHPDRAAASALAGGRAEGDHDRAAGDAGGRLGLRWSAAAPGGPAAGPGSRRRRSCGTARSGACPGRSPAGRRAAPCAPWPARASAAGGAGGERRPC